MPVIRVLVAEDSPTVRNLLVAILESDPDIRVVGQASNGVQAVELAVQLRPDVVTMDIFMPLMDGLDATRAIMTRAPTRIIIVSSANRQDAVHLSMDAMSAGALAVIGTPGQADIPAFNGQRTELVAMVRTMAGVKVVRRWDKPGPERVIRPTRQRVELVAMAASSGGPAAVRQILADLPASFPTPILLVQHIAHGFARGFANWLNGECSLRVRLAVHGEKLEPGTVHVAPDDRHLGLDDRLIRLSAEAPVNGLRPSATYLFRSAAALGTGLVAVILTGMGNDGVAGLAAVKAAGGRVIAQDEASSVVYGMPGEARAANVVDAVLPLSTIARQLSAWSMVKK